MYTDDLHFKNFNIRKGFFCIFITSDNNFESYGDYNDISLHWITGKLYLLFINYDNLLSFAKFI